MVCHGLCTCGLCSKLRLIECMCMGNKESVVRLDYQMLNAVFQIKSNAYRKQKYDLESTSRFPIAL